MHNLTCQLCCDEFDSTQFDFLVAIYLFHCIQMHWDYLQLAHNNPDLLARAMEIVT